jgi:hypothetical protein
MVHLGRPLLLAVLIGGSSLPAAAQDAPDLVGTWKGTAEAVHVGPTPYRTGETGVNFSTNPLEFTFVISEQQGNRFVGELSTGEFKETVIGALRPDNAGGVMLDNDGRFDFTLRDADAMDLCYGHSNQTSRVVGCYTLTRAR